MININIKNNIVKFDGEEIPLSDIIIHIHEIGSIRADYILQIVRKHEGMANRFSIAEKLAKFNL